jgi:hypothetical protein
VKEQDVVRSVIRTLNASMLCHVWRCQSGRLKLGNGWMYLAPAGTPDIIGLMLDGAARFVGLEVKLPKKSSQRNPEQVAWGEMALKRGVVYGCVRSPQEALDVVRRAYARERLADASARPLEAPKSQRKTSPARVARGPGRPEGSKGRSDG